MEPVDSQQYIAKIMKNEDLEDRDMDEFVEDVVKASKVVSKYHVNFKTIFLSKNLFKNDSNFTCVLEKLLIKIKEQYPDDTFKLCEVVPKEVFENNVKEAVKTVNKNIDDFVKETRIKNENLKNISILINPFANMKFGHIYIGIAYDTVFLSMKDVEEFQSKRLLVIYMTK